MLFFCRRRVLLDTDAGELMRCKMILDANGIAYEVVTTMTDNLFSRRFNARAAEFRTEAYSKMARQSYLYHLYVRPGDYARAKKLIS